VTLGVYNFLDAYRFKPDAQHDISYLKVVYISDVTLTCLPRYNPPVVKMSATLVYEI